MPSENQYQKAVLPLQGGLDFVDEALDTNRGTLSECLNYEIVDRLGYSRINGYEIYDDKGYNSSLVYTNLVEISFNAGIITGLIAGEALYNMDIGETSAGIIGYVVSSVVSQQKYLVAITNYKAFLAMKLSSTILKGADSSESATVVDILIYYDTTAATSTASMNSSFYSDNRVRMAPNSLASTDRNGPLTALHWYKDALYAISDYVSYSFTAGSVQVFPGDTLTDTSASSTTKVKAVTVTSGGWSTADAAGTITVGNSSNVAAPSGQQTVVRGGVATNCLSITSYAGNGSTSGLFKATSTGAWEDVNLGYSFAFTGGQSNGPPTVFSRGQGNSVSVPLNSLSIPGFAVDYASGPWTANGGPTDELDALSAQDTKYMSFSSSLQTPATYMQVKNFASATGLPADSQVTGVELIIYGAGVNAVSRNPYWLAQPIDNSGEIGTSKTGSMTNVTSYVSSTSVTLGGQYDTWGLSDIRTNLANGFGFNIAPRQLGSSGSTNFILDKVELRIYYTQSVSSYYFWNGTDDVQASITGYYVASGDWTTNDARGFMQVADIVPVGSATRQYITGTDQIRTAAGGGGALIATVEEDASYNYLPTYADLQANESRYQLITSNFYGNEEWESIYGVSGAGQAFVYDGFYFRTIYTGLAPSEDKPRHIAYHQSALALGYRAGNVTLSVNGDPENYSGILGAVSIDLGDSVTGLVRMSGTALGVFCRGSVNTITGTNIDNYSVTTVMSTEGAIEYSVLDIGQPLYCSNNGISLVSQTAAYGGFAGIRLSEAITPWILPRIQRTRNPLPVTGESFSSTKSNRLSGGVGFMFALPVRSKNQIRYFFEDGMCLTMTLVGAQRNPAFTLQQYDKTTVADTLASSSVYGKFIPLAGSSAIDKYGRERIHMSHYSPKEDAAAAQNVYYAYEFDRSWSFMGHPIKHSIRLNENFLGDAFEVDKLMKIACHGLSHGYAPLKVSVGYDYGEPGAATRQAVDISLPRTPTTYISQDPASTMNVADVGSRGRSFNIKLFYPPTGAGVVSPPHSLQTLLLQYSPAKGDV